MNNVTERRPLLIFPSFPPPSPRSLTLFEVLVPLRAKYCIPPQPSTPAKFLSPFKYMRFSSHRSYLTFPIPYDSVPLRLKDLSIGPRSSKPPASQPPPPNSRSPSLLSHIFSSPLYHFSLSECSHQTSLPTDSPPPLSSARTLLHFPSFISYPRLLRVKFLSFAFNPFFPELLRDFLDPPPSYWLRGRALCFHLAQSANFF